MPNLCNHLICPDCAGKLVVSKQLICESCGRIFRSDERFLNLLPKSLIQADLAEEQFWEHDRREGIKAHPLLSLISKRDYIYYFYDQILPKLELKGRILEIGSGVGWLSSLIKSSFPTTFVVESDVAPSALTKGSQVSDFMGSPIDYFVACKVENLPFENNFFDCVLGSAVLHHTCPQKACAQISRVLKDDGMYLGWQEPAVPKILSLLLGKFGSAGHREKALGVKEGEYSFLQWKKFFDEAGFKAIRVDLNRDPEYRQMWFAHSYYKLIAPIPEHLIKRYFFTSINIGALK